MVKFRRDIARVTTEKEWLIGGAMFFQGLQKIRFISQSNGRGAFERFEFIFYHESGSSVFQELESSIVDHGIWKDHPFSMFN